jgi:glycosyltransferase involved in cell wall biosynthesis
VQELIQMNMDRKPPRVSLGMPVYNGEDFLANAIESVLAQSFGDFELLISDNASTDRTPEICREFSVRDARVRYRRNIQNVGLVNNHNGLVEMATGEFFMWIAHDDALDREYLARCVEVLDGNPDAALCFAKTRNIGADGRPLTREVNPRRIPVEDLKTDSPDPRVRFRSIIQLNHECEPVYGVIRTNLLRQTRLHGKYADSDRVFLAELVVRGRFLMVPEGLFTHREHDRRSVHAYPSRQARTALMDPAQAGKIVFPYWRELLEFLRCLRNSRLPAGRRCSCYWETFLWMENYRSFLCSDLYVAALEIAKSILPVSARRAIKRVLSGSTENP